VLKITHRGDEVEQFFGAYFNADRKVLYIGTVGFNDVGLHFPLALTSCKSIDYRFFVEKRTDVSAVLSRLGQTNREVMTQRLAAHPPQFFDIDVVADDEAITAGRNAVRATAAWLKGDYTDIVVDATAMSRGVCFSIALQVVEHCWKRSISPHILVAERNMPDLSVKTTSSDQVCYMHGFQGDMDLDAVSTALKMWVPQLSENNTYTLERIHQFLAPSEVCPTLPFPSAAPRRADELMLDYRIQLASWGVSFLDVIYADESDPIDVCNTIGRLHRGRADVFKGNGIEARTILTPSGWRVGSIGMLLASLEYQLPVVYAESIGYTASSNVVPVTNFSAPACRWHLMLLPKPR